MASRSGSRNQGFTLVELLLVVGVMGTLGSMAVLQIAAIRPGLQGDGAMRVVAGQLNAAREMAIAHRRNIEVAFVSPRAVRLTRRNLPTGTTVLATIPFEGGVQYGLLGGASDTPDSFGNGTSVRFSSSGTLMFNPEGMLVNNSGAPVNGTVFLIVPGMPQSFRAVTVLGVTGRVRAYRWSGTIWMRV